MILIAAWSSDGEQAAYLLSKAKVALRMWPEGVLDSIGDLDEWYSELRELIENPEKIEETVEEEIKRFGLEKIPVRKLIVDSRVFDKR